jgi:hypothetical protein
LSILQALAFAKNEIKVSMESAKEEAVDEKV